MTNDPCDWKRRYGSWAEAEREALLFMDDMRDGKLKRWKGGTMFAYQCAEHFHIGHQPLLKESSPDGR